MRGNKTFQQSGKKMAEYTNGKNNSISMAREEKAEGDGGPSTIAWLFFFLFVSCLPAAC